jgi:hypothetical protein
MSAKVGAFNGRSPKMAAAAVDNAWKVWKGGCVKGRSRGRT